MSKKPFEELPVKPEVGQVWEEDPGVRIVTIEKVYRRAFGVRREYVGTVRVFNSRVVRTSIELQRFIKTFRRITDEKVIASLPTTRAVRPPCVGQIWQDNDERIAAYEGEKRQVEVEHVDEKKQRVRISRVKNGRTIRTSVKLGAFVKRFTFIGNEGDE